MNHTAKHTQHSLQKNGGQKYLGPIFLSAIFLTPLIAAEPAATVTQTPGLVAFWEFVKHWGTKGRGTKGNKGTTVSKN